MIRLISTKTKKWVRIDTEDPIILAKCSKITPSEHVKVHNDSLYILPIRLDKVHTICKHRGVEVDYSRLDSKWVHIFKDNLTLDPDYSKLHLLDSAPIDVVKSAYRTLAKTHHPDKGGDSEYFKDISVSYENILKSS